jgi:hypothetical protein
VPLYRVDRNGLLGRDELDDDAATVSTKTEDDPVSLAMRATLDNSDDDEIVYPKQNLTPG